MKRRHRPRLGCAALGALAGVMATLPASGKELHWKALEVDARLESDGTLAVSELQQMVFTGDWNGGERSFRLFPGQDLELERITRIDPATGEARELRRGDLDAVDRWDWADSDTVRWRSRRPEDPVFDGTRIDYRLDYRLTGALRHLDGGGYRLNHDFAFSDRDGIIERVVVRLELGDGWRSLAPLPVAWERGALAPGQGFVVPLELEFRGDRPPAHAAPPRLGPELRWGVAAAYLALVAYFLVRLWKRDRALGRFGAPSGPPIDRSWLEANVFALPPEVVGAAWDRNVGSAEVAALLARLTAEGKLTSEVKSSGNWIVRRDDLHLKLLVDRTTLTDAERPLIEALFGGSDTTDTQSLRERYRGTGFDPASKIRGGVETRLKRIRGFAEGSPKPSWMPTALLLFAGLIALAIAFVAFPRQRGFVFVPLVVLTLSWLLFGLTGALAAQGRIGGLFGPGFWVALVVVLHAGSLGGIAHLPGVTWLHLAGALCWATGLARATFNIAATRESAESLARRRELVRARDWLASELRKPQPGLEDRWFPYLLAFGLATNVDRWFRKFGGAARSGSWTSTSTAGGGFGGGGGSSWTGGGGSFGGGGASASWALAATAMSAGVAAPSSSGGSGGGGGGGSSGGGGGGGW